MYLYEDVIRKYEKELQRIVDKNELTSSDLEATYKIVDILKDVETICAMREHGESWEDDWSGRGNNPSGRNQYSGRYSGRGMRMSGNYSGGYSGHGKDPMMESLYDAMERATSDEERMAIKALIDKHNR